MSTHYRFHLRTKASAQSGRSLIELMIALAIGLIILGAILVTTAGSNFNGLRSDAQSRLSEDAQIIQNLLIPQLRMAGYSSVQTSSNNLTTSQRFSGPGIRGCENGFTNLTTASWNASLGDDQSYSTRVTCAAGTGRPAFAVLYEGDQFNTLPGEDGLPTDCLGNQIDPVPSSLSLNVGGDTDQVFVVENRYYLNRNATTGLLTLMCKGNAIGTSAQPLVDNIEQMRVTYGINQTVTSINSAARATNETQVYTTAAAIDSNVAFNADDLNRWNRVTSVQICIVLRSPQVDKNGEAGATVDCDGVTKSDRYLRKVIRTTIALRNHT